MTNKASSITLESPSSATTLARPLQLLCAFLLGAVVIYGAGFADTPALHNAAHDTRHSQGFPCH